MRPSGEAPGEGIAPTSSLPRDVPSIGRERRSRLARRLGISAFGLLVLAGATGWLGVRSTTTAAGSADGELTATLRHAQIARPALAVPYSLTVSRPGGFDGPIEVRVSTEYLEGLDENGMNPFPDASSTSDRETIWSFEPPDGDVLVIWLDTRIEPGVQWRLDGTTTVVSDGERLEIDHPTWVLP